MLRMFDLPEINRQQLIIWVVAGLVIAVVGGKYLLALRGGGEPPVATYAVATVGLEREEKKLIKVHVVGAVARPGLYDLQHGARVADAVQLAGGPSPTADLSRVNLAARLADGEQLVVPDMNATVTAGAAGGAGASGGGLINLNSASADELTELDGIGPKTAAKIINYRDEKGGFDDIEELMDVPGIGPAKFEQIKDKVIV